MPDDFTCRPDRGPSWAVRLVTSAGLLIAIALLSGALVACDEKEGGGSGVSCPQASKKLKGSLKKDMKRAQEIADRVAARERATACGRSKKGHGYVVVVPHPKSQDIHVRVMARGGPRKNYYRVTLGNKGAADKDGNLNKDPAKTHHDITDDAPDEIQHIIQKLKET